MAPEKQQAVAGHGSKAEREADLVMGVGQPRCGEQKVRTTNDIR